MTSEVKFRPFVDDNEWSSVFSVDAFRKEAFVGGIDTAEDGTAYYAKKGFISNVPVGNIFTDEVPEWATRVVWYNK